MSEVTTSLMLNDSPNYNNSAKKDSLKSLLAFSMRIDATTNTGDTARNDNSVSNANTTSLPSLPPSVENARPLPALPSTSG